MSSETVSPGQGDEPFAYLRAEIDALPVPDVSGLEGVEYGVELQMTADDFNQAPKEMFSTIAGSSMLAVTDEGAMKWQGRGLYQSSLLVRFGRSGKDSVHMLLGGSLYLAPTRADMIEPDELNELASCALDEPSIRPGVSERTRTPLVAAPGMLCRGGFVYYRPAVPIDQLDFKNTSLLDVTLERPVKGEFISVERGQSRVETFFVHEQALVLSAVNRLFRSAGGKLYQRF